MLQGNAVFNFVFILKACSIACLMELFSPAFLELYRNRMAGDWSREEVSFAEEAMQVACSADYDYIGVCMQ